MLADGPPALGGVSGREGDLLLACDAQSKWWPAVWLQASVGQTGYVGSGGGERLKLVWRSRAAGSGNPSHIVARSAGVCSAMWRWWSWRAHVQADRAPSWEGSEVMNRPDVAAVFHFWDETSIAGFRAAR